LHDIIEKKKFGFNLERDKIVQTFFLKKDSIKNKYRDQIIFKTTTHDIIDTWCWSDTWLDNDT